MFFRQKKKPVDYPQSIWMDGREIPCRVTAHPKSKKVWFRIKGDGILRITAPPGLPLQELMDLIKKNTPWIREHLEAVRDTGEKGFKDGIPLLYKGQKIVLHLKEGPEGRVTIEKTPGALHVRAGRDLSQADCSAVLVYWYREEARQIFTEKTRYFAGLMQLKFKKIFIKDQKTRWGSCSSQGNLNYNYRLVMAPETIMDYIVVHELCHLAHPNHSREFWDMVGRYYPAYKEARKWLKEKGSSLKQF